MNKIRFSFLISALFLSANIIFAQDESEYPDKTLSPYFLCKVQMKVTKNYRSKKPQQK